MERVLFVCIHNSARSQMAEAFVNELGKGRFIAESAGLEKGNLNPVVVEVMEEIGYDISGNETNSVFEFLEEGRAYDYVIKVCDQSNAEACPIFPSQKVSWNWDFPDPSALAGTHEEKLAATREIRDIIKERVEAFLSVAVAG